MGNATSLTGSSSEAEGTETLYDNSFIKPLPTEVEIRRVFDTTGVEYHLELFAENMHNSDDYVHLTWLVMCGNPILPADWTITFDRHLYVQDYFNLTFTVKPEADLPTKVRHCYSNRTSGYSADSTNVFLRLQDLKENKFQFHIRLLV